MNTIQIKDKQFKTFISEASILKDVTRVAGESSQETTHFLSVS